DILRVRPNDVAIQDALANALEALGENHYETGSMQDAVDADTRALELRESLAQSGAPNDRFRLAMGLNHVGMVHSRGLGHTAEGQAFINRALDLCEDLARENPSAVAYRIAQADILRNLGRSKTDAADFTGAFTILTRELTLREHLAREHPDAIIYQDGLGTCLLGLSAMANNIRQPAQARDYCGRAVGIYEKLMHDHPDVPGYRDKLARARVTRASPIVLLGDHRQAIAEA